MPYFVDSLCNIKECVGIVLIWLKHGGDAINDPKSFLNCGVFGSESKLVVSIRLLGLYKRINSAINMHYLVRN